MRGVIAAVSVLLALLLTIGILLGVISAAIAVRKTAYWQRWNDNDDRGEYK